MRKISYALLFLILASSWASAQLMTVTGEFRIVTLDPEHMRVGIARVEDDPTLRQNWVYIKKDTVVIERQDLGGGKFRDEVVTREGLWKALEKRKGQVIRVHGGRDWNGTIDAKNLWL